jgi:hypothetical protein
MIRHLSPTSSGMHEGAKIHLGITEKNKKSNLGHSENF